MVRSPRAVRQAAFATRAPSRASSCMTPVRAQTPIITWSADARSRTRPQIRHRDEEQPTAAIASSSRAHSCRPSVRSQTAGSSSARAAPQTMHMPCPSGISSCSEATAYKFHPLGATRPGRGRQRQPVTAHCRLNRCTACRCHDPGARGSARAHSPGTGPGSDRHPSSLLSTFAAQEVLRGRRGGSGTR